MLSEGSALIIALCVVTAVAIGALVSASATQANAGLSTASVGVATAGRGDSPAHLVGSHGGRITSNDVVQFVLAQGMPKTLSPRAAISDVQVTLLTGKQISVLLHGEATGYPDGAPLYFVQMHGTFVFPNAPGKQPITAHIGYEVFDPITGDLVMFGSLG